MEWRVPLNISTPPTTPPPKTRKKTVYESDLEFESFWAIYPKRDAKQDAIKAWNQTKKDRPPLDTLKRAVNAYTAFKKGKHITLIALAGTWLRGHQWEDESIKKFMYEEKVSTEPKISPKEAKLLELKGQKQVMIDLGSEKALRVAGEIQEQIDQLEGS